MTADQRNRAERNSQRTRSPLVRCAGVAGLIVAGLSGCMGLSTSRNNSTQQPPGELRKETPSAAELVKYLNDRTAAIQSLESRDLDLDIKMDKQAFGVRGELFCQKPKNFRMLAKMPALGKRVADFGSNDREFWYWISEDKPPDQYFCTYTDLARGDVRLPFPMHPDWMLEALGLGAPAPIGTPEEEQARGRTLEVKKTSDNRFIELYERTRSAQGLPVIKVTTLNNFNATGSQPQVVGYFLYDANNLKTPICHARVTKVQYDQASHMVVPQKIELTWPSMNNLSLVMTLGDISVNNPNLSSNPKLFARPHSRDIREVDLAKGAPIMTPTRIQRGAMR